MTKNDGGRPSSIEPLPYHSAIREYLRTEEADIWKWYASQDVRGRQAEAIRFDLLKSTYRIDAESEPALYQIARDVASALSLELPITIYQAQNPQGLNASLAYLPDEAHVVLHGPIATRLAEPEIRALFAHELGHQLLWKIWDGDLLLVDQILAALTHDSGAEPAHFESARRFALYNEIYCDRAALAVTGDPHAVIAMLIKVQTEIEAVDPESYLKQANEILETDPDSTEEQTHPAAYVRARALQLWHESDAGVEERIANWIEGPLRLSSLDLLGQGEVTVSTRRLVDAFLAPQWIQSETVLAHARLFFPDYEPPKAESANGISADGLLTGDPHLEDYFCYVLLDFVAADRDLEEAPLAAALILTETLGLKERFSAIAAKELRLRKRQLAKIDEQKERLVRDAPSVGEAR